MHGSGMFVINPPWTLAAELEATLPCIAQALALDERATSHIQQLEPKFG
jgi:23S rRNA (adenine2030-N6)-methyltransferase